MKSQMPRMKRYAYCSACGKRGYPERRIARAAAKELHDKRVSVYWCQHGGECWHVGHLWAAVVAGDLTRADIRAHHVL